MTREDGLGSGGGGLWMDILEPDAFSKLVTVVVNIKDNYLHFCLFHWTCLPVLYKKNTKFQPGFMIATSQHGF